jgi:predicted RNase H-like HicB family nuclease
MNYRFSAFITKEDDWYVARCPELGVTSQGKDVESARANLREAIELYLETWGAPDGRSAELPSSGLLSKFPPDMPKLPSVSGERVVKALKRAGFVQLRQKGSHVSLEKRLATKLGRPWFLCTPKLPRAPSRTSSSSPDSRSRSFLIFCNGVFG